jgi:hypothetical protein
VAIREVGARQNPAVTTSGGNTALPPGVTQSLTNTGLLTPGRTPTQVVTEIVANLKGAGFAGQGDLTAQLRTSLVAFQKAEGLASTGKLDAQTADRLQNLGLAGNQTVENKGGAAAARDGFERGASVLQQSEGVRASVVKNQSPDTNFLDSLLSRLGGGEGLVSGDVPSDLIGKAITGANGAGEASSTKDANISSAKKAEGSQGKGTDAGKSAPDAPVSQQLDRAQATANKVARGLQAQEKSEVHARENALDGREATTRGAQDANDTQWGVDENGENSHGEGGDHHGGDDDGAGDAAAALGETDEHGNEKDAGNAHSGDRNRGNTGRGHATLDDGSQAPPGFVRVPLMSVQAFGALEFIQKDNHVEDHRATTYSWDVTFYKPAVLAPGQKAQDVVHLVVKSATPFDPAWQKAQANLAALVRRFEPDAVPPSLDDVIAALRQARARDGDTSAAALKKITRPIGRA